MKRRTALKRPLAIAIALALAATPIPVRAIAAEDATTTVEVISNSTTGDLSFVVGNITVGDEEYGAVVKAKDGTTAELTVEGDVDSGYGIDAYVENGTADITVAGNVTSTIDDGLDVNAGKNGSATVGVNGNISSEDDAVIVTAWDNGFAAATVNGDIDAGYWGVYARAEDAGTVNETINGDITAMADAIIARTYDNSIANIDVTGNLTAGEDAIYAEAKDESAITISVTGNLAASDTYQSGISAWGSDAGHIDINVIGNVTADQGYGVELVTEGENGIISLVVDGDITGGLEGLYAEIEGENNAVSALITGTLTGGEAAVALMMDGNDGQFASDTLDLTVWRIVPVDGVVAANAQYSNDVDNGYAATYTQNEDFEATIKYIIKVEQPEAGATLTATDADGAVLGQVANGDDAYDVALEGEKVLLKVELEPGYKLTGAFNGDGEKVALSQDANGNWYVEVPKGGGVYLSVELEKEKYQAIFVNEDGSLLQTVEYEYGETPQYTGEVPTKASTDTATYSFSGWTVTTDPETGAVTYTATFTEEAIPTKPEPTAPGNSSKPEPTAPEAQPVSPAPAAAGAPVASPSIPKTGDTTNLFAPLALAGAGLALIALRRKARQE